MLAEDLSSQLKELLKNLKTKSDCAVTSKIMNESNIKRLNSLYKSYSNLTPKKIE